MKSSALFTPAVANEGVRAGVREARAAGHAAEGPIQVMECSILCGIKLIKEEEVMPAFQRTEMAKHPASSELFHPEGAVATIKRLSP